MRRGDAGAPRLDGAVRSAVGGRASRAEQEHFYLASQWMLMWWKFKRHRVAVVSGIVLLLMYGSTLVTEILVPYNLHSRHTDFIYASPQSVHWLHEGKFVGPFVYPLVKTLNMETLRREYSEDTARPYPLRFFCSGDRYEFWGLFEASFHLVCPPEGAHAVPRSAPTAWAATCCRASSTARGSR